MRLLSTLLAAVLAVVYLVFNQGWTLPAGADPGCYPVRAQLTLTGDPDLPPPWRQTVEDVCLITVGDPAGQVLRLVAGPEDVDLHAHNRGRPRAARRRTPGAQLPAAALGHGHADASACRRDRRRVAQPQGLRHPGHAQDPARLAPGAEVRRPHRRRL